MTDTLVPNRYMVRDTSLFLSTISYVGICVMRGVPITHLCQYRTMGSEGMNDISNKRKGYFKLFKAKIHLKSVLDYDEV